MLPALFRSSSHPPAAAGGPEPDSHPRSAAHAARVAGMLRNHYDDVWRVLRRLGVAEGSLEDAAQQVFIVASSKADRIEVGKERAFLLGTAVRVAANHRRTAVVRYERASDDLDASESEGPRADDLVDEKRLRALLDDLLTGLPEELRTVFVLYELEELGVSEIADSLGIPRGTAASRLRRAREAFEAAARRLRARRPGLERA
jgi:RNA polymerase sigma-70 factor (ECF subfamily)